MCTKIYKLMNMLSAFIGLSQSTYIVSTRERWQTISLNVDVESCQWFHMFEWWPWQSAEAIIAQALQILSSRYPIEDMENYKNKKINNNTPRTRKYESEKLKNINQTETFSFLFDMLRKGTIDAGSLPLHYFHNFYFQVCFGVSVTRALWVWIS